MFPLCSEKSDWREGPKREPNLVGDRYTTVMSVTRPLHLGDGRSVPWRRRPGDNWIGVGRKFSLHPLKGAFELCCEDFELRLFPCLTVTVGPGVSMRYEDLQ